MKLVTVAMQGSMMWADSIHWQVVARRAAKVFRVMDGRCSWLIPPDDCADEANAVLLRSTGRGIPREAAIFWYPHRYLQYAAYLTTYANDLQDAINTCKDDVERHMRWTYESFSQCLTAYMSYSPRVIVVTSHSGSDLVCPTGVVIEKNIFAHQFYAAVYMLPDL